MNKKGFIKNESLLDETHEVDDLLDFSVEIEKFTKRLDNIDKSVLIGLIGDFGTGKSTMLYQMSKNKNENSCWVQFDAWKYPERNHLWEGFVLDLADQLGQKEKVLKRIEGKSAKSKIVDITTDVLGVIAEKLEGLNFLDKFVELFEKSPAKRVFELQEILKGLINQEDRKIFIVVEDIDRSGDKGIYFLETLRQFIRCGGLENKIIIIVPISTNNYEDKKTSYFKSLDYQYVFNPKNINFENFIKQVFDENSFDVNSKWKTHLNMLFQDLSGLKQVNIRQLKNILRNANLEYITLTEDDQTNIDLRVYVALFAVKNIGERMGSLINNTYQLSGEFAWLKKYLIFVANNAEKAERWNFDFPLVFVSSGRLKIPNLADDFNDGGKKYFLSDFYLQLLEIY